VSGSRIVRWLPLCIVVLVGVLSIRLIGPSVPDEIYLLTGPEKSAFHEDGQRYKEYLEGRGVRVNLIETGGSLDNLRALAARDRTQAGFVEAGVETSLGSDESAEGLISLGSLYVEPLWLFVRSDPPIQGLEDLRGLRVVLGLEGSVAAGIAREVLDMSGVADDVTSDPFASLTVRAAADAIIAGDVDAVFTVGAPESEVLQSLLRSDTLKPVSFRRSAAYERRLPYLAAITLPEGTIDLGLNIPDTDLQQLAASVNLVTDEDLPPALVDLLLDAGAAIHGGRTLYTDHGAFPSPSHISLPLSEAAAEYYRSGPSPLRRVLPFRLATIVDRFLGFAAAVGGAALAVFGVLPRLLGMPFQISANGYWRRLERLEKQHAGGEEQDLMLAELDEILRESAELKVPLNLKPAYLELRQEMHDMRDRLVE